MILRFFNHVVGPLSQGRVLNRRVTRGQPYRKYGTFSRLRLNVEFATVLLDDLAT
jgi:hypothetical protein